MNRTLTIGATLLLASALGGCGGKTTTSPAPTRAVVKLSTTGSPAGGALIGGLDVRVGLPVGASVAAASDQANPSVQVATPAAAAASGIGAGADLLLGVVSPASGTTPAAVTVRLAAASGFGVGEFATVTCDLSGGVRPGAADFGLSGLKVVGLDGAPLAGLQVQAAVTLE
jgi:hypothetical protein